MWTGEGHVFLRVEGEPPIKARISPDGCRLETDERFIARDIVQHEAQIVVREADQAKLLFDAGGKFVFLKPIGCSQPVLHICANLAAIGKLLRREVQVVQYIFKFKIGLINIALSCTLNLVLLNRVQCEVAQAANHC